MNFKCVESNGKWVETCREHQSTCSSRFLVGGKNDESGDVMSHNAFSLAEIQCRILRGNESKVKRSQSRIIGRNFLDKIQYNPLDSMSARESSEFVDLTGADNGIPAVVPLTSRSAAFGNSMDADRMLSDDDDDAEFTALLANPALASAVRKRDTLHPGAMAMATAMSSTRRSAAPAPLALRDTTNMMSPHDMATSSFANFANLFKPAPVVAHLVTRAAAVESTSVAAAVAATDELGRVDFVIQLSSSDTLVKEGEELRLEREHPNTVSAEARLFCFLCCGYLILVCLDECCRKI
jgi:hypothetical protein